jgi:hypothetical protein
MRRMNQAWPTAFSNLWHSSSVPIWLTIGAAAVFAVVLLITLFRAERSAANGALTVITLLAIGIAVTAMLRSPPTSDDLIALRAMPATASLPALSCLDGLAGDAVETACEKALFVSAEATAAAVSYTASQITRLRTFGNVATADQVMTPELQALRRAIERDRFGFVAHVLSARDGCTLTTCAFFQSLTNTAQIANNMNERFYEGIVGRYALAWAAPPAAVQSGPPLAALSAQPIPEKPTGKPVSGDFPSAASIPPVTIMAPEPAAPGSQADRGDNTASTPRGGNPAAKKPVNPKTRAQAPVPLAPATGGDDN